MQWLDIALDLRVSVIKFASSSRYAERPLDRAVRPSDFSYKHKAERTVNLVLTPLSGHVDERIHDGLRAAFDSSPSGGYQKAKPPMCESLIRV